MFAFPSRFAAATVLVALLAPAGAQAAGYVHMDFTGIGNTTVRFEFAATTNCIQNESAQCSLSYATYDGNLVVTQYNASSVVEQVTVESDDIEVTEWLQRDSNGDYRHLVLIEDDGQTVDVLDLGDSGL